MRHWLTTIMTLAISGLIASSAVRAESSVWKVQKGDNTVYLGGTIHMLRPSDFPLPAEFQQAYDHSQQVYFETDIGGMQSPEVQARIMRNAIAPAGAALRDVLTSDTYGQLAAAYRERGLELSRVDHFRAGMAILTLQTVDLLRNGLAPEGVDMHYYTEAIADGKSIGFLEPVELQLQYLANMGQGWEEKFVQLSLSELAQTPALIEQMIRAWRSGDIGEIEDLFIDEMKRDYPTAYRSLMVERNNHWIPRIVAMFQQPGTEFVLVGAAHMAGEDGLLSQLQQRGYTVTQL